MNYEKMRTESKRPAARQTSAAASGGQHSAQKSPGKGPSGSGSHRPRKRAKGANRLLKGLCYSAVLVAVAGVAVLALWAAAQARQQAIAAQAAADAQPTPAPVQEPEPTLSPEEEAWQQALSLAEANCTGSQPALVHPYEWQANADAILAGLAADPYYQQGGFTLAASPEYPYLLAVNRTACTVTVYAAEDGVYRVPYMSMVCSTGNDTPLGYFNTPVDYSWKLLAGPCYGQYATRIWDVYLFHSVPYYTQHKDDVEYDQFNQLGTMASLGCIRLQVVDVKWIYNNCPIGTPVIIYDDDENPGPMGKPGTIYTDPANTELRGWDPTDPDPLNPWPEQFRSGTAIRSEAAQAEYNDAVADGRWMHDLTPPDLKGYSTDSSVEGTRG